MELAAALDTAKSGGLILAAVAHVFTIGYVANLLGEDEDWLHDLSTDMFPENGCFWVYGIGDGIENLPRSSLTNEPPAALRPSSNPRSKQPAVFTACSLCARRCASWSDAVAAT